VPTANWSGGQQWPCGFSHVGLKCLPYVEVFDPLPLGGWAWKALFKQGHFVALDMPSMEAAPPAC
jgi:hypothetical protein